MRTIIIKLDINRSDYERYTQICSVLGYNSIEEKVKNDAIEHMNKMLEAH